MTLSTSRRPGLLVAPLAALAALLCGCGVQTFSFATPPATPPSSTTTTAPRPDLTGVDLGRVSGRTTTTTASIGPGGATLSGTVLGPGGPVAGATVRADRFAGSSEASKQVITAADGSWTIPAILGGRYRLRAWQAPTLALITPQIFFLGATQTMSVNLPVQTFAGQAVSSAANPQSTTVGNNIDVVVAVSNQSVNVDGIVSYQPASGVQVTLNGGANLGVSATPGITDSNGDASFTLSCLSAGSSTVTGTTSGGSATTLPTITCDNVFSAPSTTTTLPGTTTTLPSGSTTTVPGTSTTKPSLP
ncbi:MAG: carboxypeptidase regulatory-like domain-containing protein [Actinomycetota bacterium]|nr:carboxypeptidase regulatory-like domain-containing protein [Actinomycetota bacterium]